MFCNAVAYISHNLYSGSVHGFEVLADPVRRRILELLAAGPLGAGDIVATVGAEFEISQPAVSQHLKVLREHRFAVVHRDGTRRIYELDRHALDELEGWLARLRPPAFSSLDALGTEIARGKRARRHRASISDGGPEIRSADEQRKTS